MPAEPQMDALVGTVLEGAYRITRLLGQGGMGAVYFGISKMKAARTQLTSASAIMGTPNYMSPEQASGIIDEIDRSARTSTRPRGPSSNGN